MAKGFKCENNAFKGVNILYAFLVTYFNRAKLVIYRQANNPFYTVINNHVKLYRHLAVKLVHNATYNSK